MIYYFLAFLAGLLVGYVVKHIRDGFYLKKVGECWIEDARELDRIIDENKRLIAERTRLALMVNESQRRNADPQKEFYSMSDVVRYTEVNFPKDGGF